MVLTVYGDGRLCGVIKEVLAKMRRFSYFSFFGEFTVLPAGTTHVIVDGTRDRERASALCRSVKSSSPDVRVLAFIDHPEYEAAKFSYLPEADAEIIFPCPPSQIETALDGFLPGYQGNDLLYFKNGEAVLLGYALRLSASENSILRLLSLYPRESFDGHGISILCSVSPESVPVLVSRINKKAALISGRKLIVSSGRKYSLNPRL